MYPQTEGALDTAFSKCDNRKNNFTNTHKTSLSICESRQTHTLEANSTILLCSHLAGAFTQSDLQPNANTRDKEDKVSYPREQDSNCQLSLDNLLYHKGNHIWSPTDFKNTL